MKKSFLTLTAALLFSAGSALAANTFIFNDGIGDPAAGSYNPGESFSFTISINIDAQPPNNFAGYSLWFETSGANNNFFTITGQTLTAGWSASATEFPDTLTTTNTPHAGFAVSGGTTQFANDLGAVNNTNLTTPGTYQLQTITFSIGMIAPGTYTIYNTAATDFGGAAHGAGRQSVVNDGNANPFAVNSTVYTITVIPEPSTWAMLVIGGIAAVGVNRFRARGKV